MNAGKVDLVVRWYRLSMARRLARFSDQVDEVSALGYEDMSHAVAEFATVVLRLVGIEGVDCSSRTPKENLAHAVEVLRSDRQIAIEDPKSTLANLMGIVDELYAGLSATRVGQPIC